MFKTKLLLSIFLFHTLLLTHLYATKTKEEIVWFQHQRPPWMINEGEYKNQGYGDKIRQIFEKELSQYNHQTIAITPTRFYKEVKKYNNLCYGPVIKLKTIKGLFYWSKPLYIMPTQRIIVLEETFKKLGSPKELSMKQLLANKSYTFGNIADIKHYPFDLKTYRKQKNVVTLRNSGATNSLIAMLQKKRIDWMYDFPLFISWHNKSSKQKKFYNYRTIKVKEAKNATKIIAFMSCIKNEFGKQTIEQINQSLTQKTILDIRTLVRSWQLDEINTNEFNKLNKKLFGF